MFKCALRATRTRYLHSFSTRGFRLPNFVHFSTNAQKASTTQPEPTNLRFTVDAEGRQIVDITFASEGLGLPAVEGYGWAQFEFGDRIGQDNRYTIARKLGWGTYSSTWLARDSIEDTFVAIKALTGHMTDLYERAIAWEPDAFRLISTTPRSPHCPPLLDEFTVPGKGSAGSHICFVMPLYGGDVQMFLKERTTALPFPLAKRILLHLLRGIAHAHERGIVHTDIKPANIFFSTTMTTDDIEAWMVEEPPRRHGPEASHDGMVQSAVSQPLPMITEDEAMRATYLLGDFGSAQPSELHNHNTIIPLLLRPPEVYLGAEWDLPADIWTFGCLVFELVTAKYLFVHQRNQKFGLDETENMLYQMMLYTREDFSPAQLQASPKAPEYFNSDCSLKKNPNVFAGSIKTRFDEMKIIPDEDATETTRLIERCLCLDPSHRSTATELLSDPWFNGVD